MRKIAAVLLGMIVYAGIVSAQISILPHLENFESEFQCPIGCAPNCNLQGSWKNTSGDNFDWTSDKGGTGSGSTGPGVDHTLGNKVGHYVYTEASCDQVGYPNKRVDLLSSYYDFTGVTGTELRLAAWYHMDGSTMGNLHFDVDTTQGQGNWINNFIPLWTDDLNQWQRKEIDISSFIGKDSIRFRFRGVTGSFAFSDMALDDILVYEPSDVDLGITDVSVVPFSCGLSAAEQLSVEITNFGLFDLNTGDTIPVSYQVDNVASVTENFILTAALPIGSAVVYTFATTADFSAFKEYQLSAQTGHPQDMLAFNNEGKASFRNYPVLNQFPYCEDFESGPGGWITEGTNNSWVMGTPQKTVINGAASGWNSWTTGWLKSQYPNGENSFVQSPCFDFTGICRPEIRLKAAWEAEYSWDGAAILYSTNQGNNWYRVGTWTQGNNWYNDNTINARPGNQTQGWTGTVADSNGSGGWVDSHNWVFNLANKPSVSFRVYFASDFSNRGEGFAFDDFQLFNGVYLGKDVSICQPGNTTLSAGDSLNGDTYLWSTGATTRTINVSTPGTYWVQVSNNSLCTTSDTINVVGVNANYAVSLGPDTTVCGEIWLDGGYLPGASYQWSNGDSVRMSRITSSGSYWVDISTPCGVVRSDTVVITVQPVVQVNLGNDTVVCGNYLLDAGGGGSNYAWSNGATSQTLLADTSGTYGVVVTATNGCVTQDEISLMVNPVPVVDLGPADSAICFGETLCLAAGSNPVYDYLWSDGSTQMSLCATQNGKYFVSVTNGFGCTGRDTLNLILQGAPTAAMIIDTSGCPIVNFIDISTGGIPNAWLWKFGDGNSDTIQFPTYDYSASGQGTYLATFISTNDCGSDSVQDIVQINCSIGWEETGLAGVSLFPNPNSGQFSLKFEGQGLQNATLELFDVRGSVLRTFALGDVGVGEERNFYLPEVARGFYWARLVGDSGTVTWKVLVE